MPALQPTPSRLLVTAALALALANLGCGGDDDDFDAPTCAAGEVALDGTIDGGHESASLSGASSYIFVNALNGELGTLTVAFGAEDMLYLEWPDLVADGASVDARGTIAFPDLAFGNCDDDGFPGTLRMNADGNGGTFRLRALHPGADCTAAQVSGEITGCFASSTP
jgi:hypothetical protein